MSTRSSHSEDNKSTSTGIAAHIYAASENGPRFNKLMSSEDRKDISNGIWLCCNCATKIDKDEKKYPASLLKEWKSEAEKRVSENHGLPFLTRSEAEKEFEGKLLKRKEELESLIKFAIQPSLVEKAEHEDIVSKLNNITESYEKEMALRQEIEDTLTMFKSRLPEAVFDEANNMLSVGDTDRAEEVLNSFVNENERHLVMAYIGRGKIAEANFNYRKALINYEKASMLSDVQPQITNHACQLAYRVGDYELAMSLIDKGLKVIGDDLIGKIIFLNQKGLIQRARGNISNAVDIFKHALNELESELDGNHWIIDTVKNNLALSYTSMGKYTEAEIIYNDLIIKDTKEHGRKSEQVCITLSSLGTIYEKNNDIKKAKLCYEEAYNTSIDLFGKKHPSTVTHLNNLALINIKSSPKKSEKTFKKILKNRIDMYGENHILTIITLVNIASSYTHQNKHLKAKKTLIRALKISVDTLGEMHPETLRVKHNLAISMYDLKEEKEAISIMSKVVEDRVKIFGSESQITKLSKTSLSEMDGTKSINMINAIMSEINLIR
ncbi:tetratricopeptide repeat protein [Vibrio sp. JC009]|uniref:tetratricopeptide repeat protein n=1 Tax=Vibrio sp. JC009 TaxID=2912314 RepID=UPI0023B0AEFF|nr:tetratricopeptide repeat protein [Vibrio sp. JC009]WED21487.1 tetratricopeptide repeat protein [Vibrio sp. JC009]